jgi:hypothetical protein
VIVVSKAAPAYFLEAQYVHKFTHLIKMTF